MKAHLNKVRPPLRKAFLLFRVLTGLTTFSVFGEEPPSAPILRMETGMHTATISYIGVDASNRWLVTGSEDKTVRVWDLGTGELVRVLRPPIGPGEEGKIYSVAISPDGSTVACGGWTGLNSGLDINLTGSEGFKIYLFDRSSGRLLRRITELPTVVTRLVYSPDSHSLAATFGNNEGVRVYRAPQGEEVARDADYEGVSNGADFAEDGRLVTTCEDGYVRLYDAKFKLTTKRRMPGPAEPYGLVFSPDGAKIAIGFTVSTRVSVLSARDLSLLYEPDTTGVDDSLTDVAFSADGARLAAGGGWHQGTNSQIRIWEQAGRGKYRDQPADSSTIAHILPLKDGGFVFGSASPGWGTFDAAGKRRLFRKSEIANFRSLAENFAVSTVSFAVSQDASQLRFYWDPKSSTSFSIPDRRFETDRAGLSMPRTSAPSLAITNWEANKDPALNGHPLTLDTNEISLSLAIAPDGNSFLLGTMWFLRLFNREGSEKWRRPVPSAAWAVNIAGNGLVALAAFADGTIRWYRTSDGEELLNFFPHGDRKRWVLWTPAGYYDCAPGAEDLIGWHVNNGKETAADFFPASKFRGTYYRPDVVVKILETLDEAEAVRLVNLDSGHKRQPVEITKSLPPVVEILSPSDGAEFSGEAVTVKFTAQSRTGEPVTSYKALVDGRPVRTKRGIKLAATDQKATELQISAPPRDCEVSVIAENQFAPSVPATIHLKWRGKEKEEFIVKPKLYVLAIGVSIYENKSLTLGFAAKDAKDFAAATQRQKDGLYRDVVTKVLTDGGATKDEILDGLDWITKETTSKDVAMVFLAGHGVNDQNGIYYYLPVNADTEKLKRTCLAFSDIKTTVETLAGKTLFFVDTCHSGDVLGKRRGFTDLTQVVNELTSAENGAVVFASSTGRQYSLEDPAWNNGAFTKALVEGLNGGADYKGTGKITLNMLDVYISERVKELTKGKQTPTTTKPQTVPDFPVALKQ